MSKPVEAGRRPCRVRHGLQTGIWLVALLAAGCGSSSESQRQAPSCPRVGILEGAGVATVHHRPGGGEGDAQALRYTAGLSEPASTCRYTAEGLEVDLSFDVLAEKGPAFEDGPLEVIYFVATLGPERRVRSKQLFRTRLRFADDRPVAGQAQSLTLRYPFVYAAEGATLDLYLGLQLDTDEIRRQQRLLP